MGKKEKFEEKKKKKERKKSVEKQGIDPCASCMLSMRSTIWATSPCYEGGDGDMLCCRPREFIVLTVLGITTNGLDMKSWMAQSAARPAVNR